MSEFNPPTTAWHVTRIEEDAFKVLVTFERVDWTTTTATDEEIENDTAEWTEAEPGEPGSAWVPTGERFVMPLGRDQSHVFDIGRHYVLALSEVQDASAMSL